MKSSRWCARTRPGRSGKWAAQARAQRSSAAARPRAIQRYALRSTRHWRRQPATLLMLGISEAGICAIEIPDNATDNATDDLHLYENLASVAALGLRNRWRRID